MKLANRILVFVLFIFIPINILSENLNYTENTPDYVLKLLKVASDEIGYKEASDGSTKYGAWAGDPKAQWCAEFLCWCVNKTDEDYGTNLLRNVYPYYSGQNIGRDWFLDRGRFISRKGRIEGYGMQWHRSTGKKLKKNEYIPKTGDFMFLGYESNFNTSHVALVEYVENRAGEYYVHVIEGNNPDSVSRNIYKIDKNQILGYGTYSNENIGMNLLPGNSGNMVKELQEKLVAIGLMNLEDVNAYYGTKTISAIHNIQNRIHHVENGIADFETQREIDRQYRIIEFYTEDKWVVED